MFEFVACDANEFSLLGFLKTSIAGKFIQNFVPNKCDKNNRIFFFERFSRRLIGGKRGGKLLSGRKRNKTFDSSSIFHREHKLNIFLSFEQFINCCLLLTQTLIQTFKSPKTRRTFS